MSAHWLLCHGGFWVAVYGQTRAGQQWPIVGCKGGSWVVLGGKVIERAYVGPLPALSWRISVGSRLANHGVGQQRPSVGFLGGSWVVVGRQTKERSDVGPLAAQSWWILGGGVWTNQSGPTMAHCRLQGWLLGGIRRQGHRAGLRRPFASSVMKEFQSVVDWQNYTLLHPPPPPPLN